MKKVIFGVIFNSGEYHIIRCSCGSSHSQFFKEITKLWFRYRCKECKRLLYDRYFDTDAPKKFVPLIEKGHYIMLDKKQCKLFKKIERLVT